MPTATVCEGEAIGDKLDDAALVAKIRAGDPDAEEVLCKRHYPAVHESALYRFNDAGMASDFCQEAFRILLEKLRAGDGPQDPSRIAGYLYGIVKNLWVNESKTRYRRRTDPDAETVERFADANPGPDGQIDREQSAEAVRQMLQELRNPGYRELLLRFYIRREEKTLICEDLGLSPAQFDTRIHRARQKFAAIVREQPEGRSL